MRTLGHAFWSDPHCRQRLRSGIFLALVLLLFAAAPAMAVTYSLGAAALLEGPAAGADSAVLAVTPETTAWTASAESTWLHLSPASQSGSGSTNLVFSYDANPGATRFGTLTMAGRTLSVTVTQTGGTYVAAPAPVTTLVSSGLSNPQGLAVDVNGDVYIADRVNNAIKKWTVVSNSVTTLISSGLSSPSGLALDDRRNLYIADTGNGSIKTWSLANSTNTPATSIVSGLSFPNGVAVDGCVLINWKFNHGWNENQ